MDLLFGPGKPVQNILVIYNFFINLGLGWIIRFSFAFSGFEWDETTKIITKYSFFDCLEPYEQDRVEMILKYIDVKYPFWIFDNFFVLKSLTASKCDVPFTFPPCF